MKRINYIIAILLFSVVLKAQNDTIQNRAIIDWQNIAIFSGGVRVGTLAGATTNAIVVVDANGNLDTISANAVTQTDSAILAIVRANVDTSGTYTDADAISAVRDSVSLDDVANVNDTTDNRLVIANYTDVSGENVLFSVIGDTANGGAGNPVATIKLKGYRTRFLFNNATNDAAITNLGTSLALSTGASASTIEFKPNNVTLLTINASSGLIVEDEMGMGDNFLHFGDNEPSNSIRGTSRLYSTATNDTNGLLKIQVKENSNYQDAVTIDSTGSVQLHQGLRDTSGSLGSEGDVLTSSATGNIYWSSGTPNQGWASYRDTTYTSAVDSFELAANTDTKFPFSAGSAIDNYLPNDVDSLWTNVDSTIIGSTGKGIDIMLYFKATPTATSQWVDIWIDIGGSIGEIYRQTFTFPKGSGVERGIVYNLSSIYTLGTWEANGGTIYIRSNDELKIHSSNLNIDIDYKPE